MSSTMRNAMTVDVEDYFQVEAFADRIDRRQWPSFASRVEANVDRILAMFATSGVSATFFTLGWIAERHPEMVRRIVAAGHEVASHGYGHMRADLQTPGEFRADVAHAKRLLEDIGGVAVRGYRAPTFSINARNQWAFGILEEEGYAYSSSVNPIRHDLYGMPDAPRTAFQPAGCTLWEVPMTTLRLRSHNLPCSGGGYFRLLPYTLFRRGLARVNRRENLRGIFYFHPWEIDPEQPRVACRWKSRLRHYTNLERMAPKLARLLQDFTWDRMDRAFTALDPAEATSHIRPVLDAVS